MKAKTLNYESTLRLKTSKFYKNGNFVFLTAQHEIKFDELISLPSLQSCTLPQNNNFSLYNIQITITIEAIILSQATSGQPVYVIFGLLTVLKSKQLPRFSLEIFITFHSRVLHSNMLNQLRFLEKCSTELGSYKEYEGKVTCDSNRPDGTAYFPNLNFQHRPPLIHPPS